MASTAAYKIKNVEAVWRNGIRRSPYVAPIIITECPLWVKSRHRIGAR
jgi:hypothetical protein